MKGRETELTALLIVPDRDLALQFTQTLPQSKAFQIISEMKAYPTPQALEIRLRQTRPDVVLVDVTSDLEAATQVIRQSATSGQSPQVVGLHLRNDSDAILRSLRAGAIEFLHAPFEVQTQHEAVGRLRRLRQPDTGPALQPGNVIVFASAKPGSGSSTVATQTAFALKRLTGERVLLADFDLMGGTIGFYLKLGPARSLLEALHNADQLTGSLWSSLVSESGGVDILPAPDSPYAGTVDSARLHAVLEFARLSYDWVLIDLPVIFQRLSLMTFSEADRAFLVATSELPSLHLTRKAVTLLDQLGFPKERFQILVNRIRKRDDIGGAEIEKLFNCPVHSRLPNDFFSLNRAVTLGQPLETHCDLGKAVEGLAGKLSGRGAKGAGKAPVAESRAILAQV